jgi:hypothetical protein
MDRRPAIPRKIARPAEMGIGRRSSAGQKKTCGPKIARPCKDGLLWTERRPMDSRWCQTKKKGAKHESRRKIF